MCGDCRSKGHHGADGRAACGLVRPDPPYNVNYEGGTEEELTIQNDSMENDLFATFLKQVFSVICRTQAGRIHYIFHADSEGENFRASLRKQDSRLHNAASG